MGKRTQSNQWLQWSGSRDKECFSGPRSKCNVTSVNHVDPLQVWDDMQEVWSKMVCYFFICCMLAGGSESLFSYIFSTFTIIQLCINPLNITIFSVHLIIFAFLEWITPFLKYYLNKQFHRIVCKMLCRHIITNNGLFHFNI